MTSVEQKRPLPPTPPSSNANKSIDPTENERKLQKLLEKKDSTISNLKTIIIEWKKKAIDAEDAYKTLERQFKEREQFLIKQHQAEIEALTKIHASETNENLELLVRLEQENKALQLRHNDDGFPAQHVSNLILPDNISSLGQLCDTAEFANQTAVDSIHHNKQDSDELIQRINDMVEAMEDTLHDFQHIQDDLTQYKQHDWATPPLVSDSSSDESYDEIDDDLVLVPKKKKVMRTSSISSLLFRNKKPEEPFHEQPHMKRPIRTSSLLSQC